MISVYIDQNFKFQIRNLISQIREYGVNENLLFNENDLLCMANIPRVSKCLKEIASIVSWGENMF